MHRTAAGKSESRIERSKTVGKGSSLSSAVKP